MLLSVMTKVTRHFVVVWPFLPSCFTSPSPGPPGDIEVVELTQKLMALRDDWPMLGPYLQLPEHELAAADVDERTLYRKISRVLRRWIDYDTANDRQKLARVLAQARDDLGCFAEEVLKKAN